MIFVELYSGHGTMAAAFAAQGFKTLTIDIRKRKGVCEPDWRTNILNIREGELTEKINQLDVTGQYGKDWTIFGKTPVVLWAGVPCPSFSFGAGDTYWKHGKFINPEIAQKSTKHLKKFFRIKEELNPDLWFIENPRGHLRHTMFFLDWLTKNNGMTKELMYSSYGMPYPKPTNIFTNAHGWKPREMTAWGKGAKYSAEMNNLTLAKRQSYPMQLCQDIAAWCNDNVPGTKNSTLKHLHHV